MKQWIPSLLLNAAIAFSTLLVTSMYYRDKYFRYIEDYKALRIVHAQLIQDTELLHRDFRSTLAEIKAGLRK